MEPATLSWLERSTFAETIIGQDATSEITKCSMEASTMTIIEVRILSGLTCRTGQQSSYLAALVQLTRVAGTLFCAMGVFQ